MELNWVSGMNVTPIKMDCMYIECLEHQHDFRDTRINIVLYTSAFSDKNRIALYEIFFS